MTNQKPNADLAKKEKNIQTFWLNSFKIADKMLFGISLLQRSQGHWFFLEKKEKSRGFCREKKTPQLV